MVWIDGKAGMVAAGWALVSTAEGKRHREMARDAVIEIGGEHVLGVWPVQRW